MNALLDVNVICIGKQNCYTVTTRRQALLPPNDGKFDALMHIRPKETHIQNNEAAMAT
jgi:hypothetical protein